MEKRTFKGNERISLLGFGCMRLPLKGEKPGDIDEEKFQEMIDLAIKRGVNYFDTAYIYHAGHSEPAVGRALAKYPRESFKLATKLPTWLIKSESDIERIFNEQLERCGVDYFDFYLVHSIDASKLDIIEKNRICGHLAEKRNQGKIRHLGFSFHDTPDVLEKVVKMYKWEFGQIMVNYIDWELQDAKRQYEILEENGIPAIVMEPVKGGALTNLTNEATAIFQKADPNSDPASWALRYAASLPNVFTVLSGMSNIDQMTQNLDTFSNFRPMTDEDYKTVKKAVAAYRLSSNIQCTACNYCMDCKFGVDIPKVFAIYNQYLRDNEKFRFSMNYSILPQKNRASSCVACGECEKACPQHLKISSLMKKVTAAAQ
ncbi:MAG: aldo/keto reductase [Clostridiales bacterium]|jgi:predicted aldo/keto reductase-like oxidoreductase|nr:aldo/keto reductase [Clostridiales bacterium]